jgi:hypothetical protein
MHKNKLKSVIQHEVSHFIVSEKFGFNTGNIKIKTHFDIRGISFSGSSVITLFKKIKSISDIKTYLENRIIILYAGVLGETLKNGKIDIDNACKLLNENGKDDYTKAGELIHLLNNMSVDNDFKKANAEKKLNGISGALWKKSHDIILAEKNKIIKLTEYILESNPNPGIEIDVVNKDLINCLNKIKNET